MLLGQSIDDIKLSDFGIARSLASITHGLTTGFDLTMTYLLAEVFRRGTSFYMAPEVFKGEEYDFSADIYSLSITIWEILYRRY